MKPGDNLLGFDLDLGPSPSTTKDERPDSSKELADEYKELSNLVSGEGTGRQQGQEHFDPFGGLEAGGGDQLVDPFHASTSPGVNGGAGAGISGAYAGVSSGGAGVSGGGAGISGGGAGVSGSVPGVSGAGAGGSGSSASAGASVGASAEGAASDMGSLILGFDPFQALAVANSADAGEMAGETFSTSSMDASKQSSIEPFILAATSATATTGSELGTADPSPAPTPPHHLPHHPKPSADPSPAPTLPHHPPHLPKPSDDPFAALVDATAEGFRKKPDASLMPQAVASNKAKPSVPLPDLSHDLMGAFIAPSASNELTSPSAAEDSIGQHLDDLLSPKPSASPLAAAASSSTVLDAFKDLAGAEEETKPKPKATKARKGPPPPSYADSIYCEDADFFAVDLGTEAETGEMEVDEEAEDSKPSQGPEQMNVNPQGQRVPYLKIKVRDPLKVPSSRGIFGALVKGGHITYKVSTTTKLQGYKPQAEVRRRFNDFVALATTLKHRFRGYFVPPRPHKNFVPYEDMQGDFVEERRIALEAYLNQLALHPVIARCEEVRLFLEVESDLSQDFRWYTISASTHLYGAQPTEVHVPQNLQPPASLVVEEAQAAAGPNDSIFSARAEGGPDYVPLDWEVPPPQDEMLLRQYRVDMQELRDQLIFASNAVNFVVHVLRTRAGAEMELSNALARMSSYEEEDGAIMVKHCGTLETGIQLAADSKSASKILLKAARISSRAGIISARHLGTIDEYRVAVPAGVKACRTREKKLAAMQSEYSDLEMCNREIREIEGFGRSGTPLATSMKEAQKKKKELQKKSLKLQKTVKTGSLEYVHLKALNEWERERFSKEMTEDFRRMLEKFTGVMASSYKHMVEDWLLLAQEFGATSEEVEEVEA